MKKALPIAATLLALVSAACGPSRAQLDHLEVLTQERDAGQLSWTQWADSANSYVQANMRTTASDNLLLAKQSLIAEEVDARRMTPAQGKVAVAQLWADYDQAHPNPVAVGLMQMSDSLKNQPLIPPQQPVIFTPSPRVTTTCSPSYGNTVQCVSQ